MSTHPAPAPSGGSVPLSVPDAQLARIAQLFIDAEAPYTGRGRPPKALDAWLAENAAGAAALGDYARLRADIPADPTGAAAAVVAEVRAAAARHGAARAEPTDARREAREELRVAVFREWMAHFAALVWHGRRAELTQELDDRTRRDRMEFDPSPTFVADRMARAWDEAAEWIRAGELDPSRADTDGWRPGEGGAEHVRRFLAEAAWRQAQTWFLDTVYPPAEVGPADADPTNWERGLLVAADHLRPGLAVTAQDIRDAREVVQHLIRKRFAETAGRGTPDDSRQRRANLVNAGSVEEMQRSLLELLTRPRWQWALITRIATSEKPIRILRKHFQDALFRGDYGVSDAWQSAVRTTLERAAEGRLEHDSPNELEAYLIGVARNKYKDVIHRQARERVTATIHADEGDDAPPEPGWEDFLGGPRWVEFAEEVDRAAARAFAADDLVLFRLYLSGSTAAEIAAAREEPEADVARRLDDLRRRIQPVAEQLVAAAATPPPAES